LGYQGSKISDLFGAIYEQGKKDGAKLVRDSFERMMIEIPHQNPGRPGKKKKLLAGRSRRKPKQAS
jgi:hypothetical protein